MDAGQTARRRAGQAAMARPPLSFRLGAAVNLGRWSKLDRRLDSELACRADFRLGTQTYTPRTAHDQGVKTSERFDRLETERLIMRRWQESDRAPFADLNTDPETMRFFPNTLDRAASVAMIETRFERQGFGFWALEVAATGTFIGFTGLNLLPDGVPGAGGMEVGWRLARHAWHHGYATEAARAALGVAFDNMGLPEIWSMTAVLNEPSQAVMRRLGLTETTRFDHPRIPPGDPLRPQVAYHGTP